MNIDEIRSEIIVFSCARNVEGWLKKEGFSFWSGKVNEYLKEGNEYIVTQTKEKVSSFLKKYNLVKFINPQNTFSDEQDDHTLAITGASVVGAGLLAEAFVFPPMILLAAIGGLFGRQSAIDKLKENLLQNSKKMADDLSKKLFDIIQKAEKREKQEAQTFFEPEPTPPPQSSFKKRYVAKELSEEQRRIQTFLEDRGIRYLVHFSNIQNYDSIKKNGLLSVAEMRKRNISFKSNDDNRYDGALDYISLSVTDINKKLLNSYEARGSFSRYKVFYIDAAVLYLEKTERIYCVTNAATAGASKGSNVSDLYNMFQPQVKYTNTSGDHVYNRQKQAVAYNSTTDPQAEILFKTCIPPKYIDWEKTDGV